MKGYLLLGMLFLNTFTFSQTLRTPVQTAQTPAVLPVKNSILQSRQSTLSCNNWLSTPSQPSYVDIGSLNITGNKITVEAVFNRTSFLSNGVSTEGDLVSKHQSPSDANYILRPTRGLITTNTGFYQTPDVCGIQLNKTYHVAMVYDGAILKFYRNGFLMSQVAANGNLFQNNWRTYIGYLNPQNQSENFIGYINEVRIWNIARTQNDIRTYMNGPLPNPTTQTGLLAYYTFDNLLNKQGNSAWNGTLGGSASINNANPSCTFVADSCGINLQPGISNIINTYTPVIEFLPCENKLTVEDGSTFNVGDTVLLIQMKGAIVDTTNSSNFGNIISYGNAGNYEFNYVKSRTGNVIELNNQLTRQYTIPTGKVQLIRVPYYYSTNVSSTLTCLPWDGNKGGVLAFNVRDTLTLSADIDVTGKGFKGGSGVHSFTTSENCNQNQFFYPVSPFDASEKGEGIAIVSAAKSYGKGKNANGGGGGNSHNSGGAGGSNGGTGGLGGYQYELGSCSGTVPFDNRGIGGQILTYGNSINKVFLGGGAGAGQANNAQLFFPKGGNGSGIAIISANYLQGNNKNILLKGENALECTAGGTGCHEGMGGGGSGGALLLSVNQTIGNIALNASGGKGGDMTVGGNGRLGPGGGGSGGIIWAKQTLLGATINVGGGANGLATAYSNDAWGSTIGGNGQTIYNLVIQNDTVLFQKNIDSVRIKDSLTGCRTIDFKGLAFVRSAAIATWQWTFGDGGTASTQNTIHQYATTGNFLVKLVVTDANGCKDSISKTVTITACNGISNIINTYTPVTGLLPCENKLTVEDGSTFNAGDTVLIIQMKGAIVDTTNTAAFGTVINYGNAGNYEFNYVKSRTGNVVELKNNLTRQYTIPAGKVQLIRVPYYYSTDVSSTLTCLPWDGSKGGVLVFNVRDTLTLSADMDVTGKGFRGGEVVNSNINTFSCSFTDYYYPVNTINAAGKGESIADLNATKNAGKGAKASAGGGGMNPNTGGGGGGNGNSGGRGGYGYGDCPNYTTAQNWGLGGYPLLFNNNQNKIYLGGGGGAGHCNNGFTDPSVNTNFNGGNGGGIIIVTAKTIAGNNKNIISKGNLPYELTGPGFLAHDGMGGGGAGGTVLLNAETYISNINTNVAGARGGNMSSSPTGGKVGPGGGGSGGAIWVKQATTPAAIIVNAAGGTNGVILQDANNPYGAEPGLIGITRTALVVPIDTVLFQKNIDSVRIKDSLYNCNIIDFKGFGFIRLAPIVSWQWTFGDGGTASTQNTIHPYQNAGNYLVKLVVTDANGCKDSITKPVTILGANTSDFSFELNPCNPLQVNFISNASSPVTNYWSFGDGSTLLNTQSPNHTFSSGGNYNIRYSSTSGGCTDTITKTVSVGVAYQNIILTNDTTICPGATKQLSTISSSPFCWSPATYLNNPLLANPITNTPQNITYYFTSLITGNNLVTNGNFSGGNTGFTSEYIFTAANNSTSGQYNVSGNAGVWLGNGVACNADHTTGSGNMLMINGATTANKKVWAQTINVTPNTNYELSGWLAGLGTTNTAKIQYAINSLKVGNQVTASSTSCQWNRFSTIWNSGNQTAIELSIINISTDVQGNDFALDDLSFTVVSIRRDSVIIKIDTPVVKAGNDTSVCRNDTVRLQATGSQVYTWSPSAGLSNPNINNPVATPFTNTQYIVTGTSAFGCTAKDTVNIVINPLPVISALTNDTTVCRNVPLQLNASGGTNYNWQPAGTISNPQIANPIATPTSNTTYYVTVTGANNCSARDSVKVSIAAPPSFTADPVKSTCLGEQVQLRASGGNSYLWTPVNGLSTNNVSNPMANPAITTTYTVKIKESTCNDSATLYVLVNVLPLPDVRIRKSNDIDCSVGLARLAATGATSYRWSPGGSLSDSTAANPMATPQISTLYTVIGYSSAGCANTDTLSVLVKYEGNGAHYMPNAFTPNGDGLNECFGIKNWGQVTDLTFAIYNRWGERVFFTTNPGVCWDGRYKNEFQQSGNFVYIVKAKTACGAVDIKGSVLLIR